MTRMRWDRARKFKAGTISIKDEADQLSRLERRANRILESDGKNVGSTDRTCTPRELGLNSRALGINPRALGVNPRAIGANPKAQPVPMPELRTVKWLPSPADVEAGRTPRGGWTRATLAKWGVPWPPPHGWRQELERRWRVKMRAYAKAHEKPLR